jgi:hypothetical protein
LARLTSLSGLGGKLPAAFLLEIASRRILLDLGEGPEPGVFPDLSGVGPVDALVLSHAHQDHCGGLPLSPCVGDPPVYATAATFRQIDEARLAAPRRRLLPDAGQARIAGLPITLGRSGHAPGGIWIHVDADGGFLYTGDWSCESALLPFDPPPPAGCLLTDASYGDRSEPLAGQIAAVAEAARAGAVLPVPAGGRGPEVALALAGHGLLPRLCPVIHAELAGIASGADGVGTPRQRAQAAALLAAQPTGNWQARDVIIATEANGEAGHAATLLARSGEGFRFLFSSHVPDGTPAADLLAAGSARWLGWNVHPRLADTLALAEATRAIHVLPAFARPEAMTALRAGLGARMTLARTLDFGPSSATHQSSASEKETAK